MHHATYAFSKASRIAIIASWRASGLSPSSSVLTSLTLRPCPNASASTVLAHARTTAWRVMPTQSAYNSSSANMLGSTRISNLGQREARARELTNLRALGENLEGNVVYSDSSGVSANSLLFCFAFRARRAFWRAAGLPPGRPFLPLGFLGALNHRCGHSRVQATSRSSSVVMRFRLAPDSRNLRAKDALNV